MKAKEKKEKDAIDRLLDQIDFHGMTAEELAGEDGLLSRLTSRFYTRALEAEMEAHLGYRKNDKAGDNSGNSRNGHTPKTVITKDEGENGFVRAYAAEAIGAMKKPESVEILSKLFESSDPNLRCYVIKGISNFDTDEAKQLVIQGIKDSQYKVRLEAISAAEKMKISQAVPYLIYRAKNDSEKQVKNKAYETLAKLGTSEADSFLLEQLSDKKSSDTVKYTVAEILLKHTKTGRAEIAGLASELVKDERRKPFCVNFGKLIAKYPESAFASVCEEYLSSKDSAVSAIGLDIYSAGKFPGAESAVRKIAEETKPSANKNKARKILKMDEEEKD